MMTRAGSGWKTRLQLTTFSEGFGQGNELAYKKDPIKKPKKHCVKVSSAQHTCTIWSKASSTTHNDSHAVSEEMLVSVQNMLL